MNFSAEKRMAESNSILQGAVFSEVNKILSGYKTGFELVTDEHSKAIERFVVIYVRGVPRLLLPPAQKVMLAAIAGFGGGRGHGAVASMLVKSASLAGGRLSSISSNLSLVASQAEDQSPLRELIAGVLGRNDFQMALRLSFGRPNAKTVAMAISNSGEVLCFAKFGSEAMTNDLVAHESAILEQFAGTNIPVIIPRKLYSDTWAGNQNVLITAPLQLESLKGNANIAHQGADAFANQTFVTNSPLRDSSYWHRIVDSVDSIGDEQTAANTLQAIVTKIEQVWGDCRFDFGASHGDWTRANLGMVKGQLAAIDWERCTMLAPRGIDIAHFAVCEKSIFPIRRSPNTEKAVKTVQHYLDTSDQLASNAQPLVLLALLEMAIRFQYAQKAGLRSADRRFGPALNASLEKWST